GDVEDGREVADGGDFVSGGGMGEEFAAGAVFQFFGGDPAHALDEAADDLAAVDAGVQGDAGVHQQVDAADAELAGEAVDFDFGCRCSIRVVEEGGAFAGIPVEIDAWGGVEAALAEVHSVEIGLHD